MKTHGKSESGKQKAEKERQDHRTTDHETTDDGRGDGRILVTRRGLAGALGVSLRTVERMLHDEEIEAVRLRGAVRFHVADVVECLRNGNRKWGRKAVLQGTERTEGTQGT